MLKSFLLFPLLYANAIIGDLANAEGCKSNNCVTKCQSKWELKDGHCYFWGNRSLSWDDAEAFCKREGGHLISVASLAYEEGSFACRQSLCSGVIFSPLNIDIAEQGAYGKQRLIMQTQRTKHLVSFNGKRGSAQN